MPLLRTETLLYAHKTENLLEGLFRTYVDNLIKAGTK